MNECISFDLTAGLIYRGVGTKTENKQLDAVSRLRSASDNTDPGVDDGYVHVLCVVYDRAEIL